MKCSKCGSTRLMIVDSCDPDTSVKKAEKMWPKRLPQGNSRFRRRNCADCLEIHWTLEQVLDRAQFIARKELV